MKAFEVFSYAPTPDRGFPIGVVLHVPHASMAIPPDVRVSFLLNDEDLAAELLRMTDRYTDELFSLRGNRVERVVFPVSRLVVDPERFLDDADEPMASRGMGVVYTRTSQGQALRSAIPEEGRTNLLARFYVPHHHALEQAVGRMIDTCGRCLILDAHSFSSVPLPHEWDQDPDRPMVCIGTDEYHTPHDLTDIANETFESLGFTTRLNAPFSGALVPLAFHRKDARVSSLMIELNRSLYMDEETGRKNANFSGAQSALETALKAVIASVGGRS